MPVHETKFRCPTEVPDTGTASPETEQAEQVKQADTALTGDLNPAGARRAPFAEIDGDDTRQRSRSALGYITPEQAERNAS